MAQEKENFLETLFRIGALMGGAWIGVEIIKMLGKLVYTCPNCDNVVQRGTTTCPNCKVGLAWKI
jgi:rubrerythrin